MFFDGLLGFRLSGFFGKCRVSHQTHKKSSFLQRGQQHKTKEQMGGFQMHQSVYRHDGRTESQWFWASSSTWTSKWRCKRVGLL